MYARTSFCSWFDNKSHIDSVNRRKPLVAWHLLSRDALANYKSHLKSLNMHKHTKSTREVRRQYTTMCSTSSIARVCCFSSMLMLVVDSFHNNDKSMNFNCDLCDSDVHKLWNNHFGGGAWKNGKSFDFSDKHYVSLDTKSYCALCETCFSRSSADHFEVQRN